MAAEIVVVVENEDAGIRVRLSIEIRGRQTADSCPDDDKIVDTRIGFLRWAPVASGLKGELVNNVERTIVIAAHARQRRRIAGGAGRRCKNLVGQGLPRD